MSHWQPQDQQGHTNCLLTRQQRGKKPKAGPRTQQKAIGKSLEEPPWCTYNKLAGKHGVVSTGALLMTAWGSVQSFCVKISDEECAIPTGMAYGNDKQKLNE